MTSAVAMVRESLKFGEDVCRWVDVEIFQVGPAFIIVARLCYAGYSKFHGSAQRTLVIGDCDCSVRRKLSGGLCLRTTSTPRRQPELI